ncbi:MAG TPA: WYL domain-containing protein [Candidatus Paceibacterota bacterium]|nr:WYL domain-containing protein [Candidatus Paceibacterota bacterium]
MKIIFSQKIIKKDNNNLSNNIDIDDYNLDYTGYQTNVYDPSKREYEQLPEISPENLYQYLEDNYEEDQEEENREERIKEDLDIGVEKYEEPPIEVTDEELPEFKNTSDAMSWAQDNNRIVRINYITKKGNDLTRLVEPHGQFFAKTTGNNILVVFDKTIGKIRAFIVDKIINFVISKENFVPKFRVTGNRGLKNMSNVIFDSLKNIGDDLDNLKMSKQSATITDIMQSFLNIKTAQYVGIQGYWIRNRRCFDNCYRQKRAENKNKPAQEVWFDCQKEYEASINNDYSGWEKYAGEENMTKIAGKQKELFEKENKYFQNSIKKAMKNNVPFENAVYASIDQGVNRYEEKIINNATELIEMAAEFKKAGYEDISEKMANTSMEMIKEAQVMRGLWEKMKGIPGQIGRGVQKGVQNLRDTGAAAQVNSSINKIKKIVGTASEQMNLWGQNAVTYVGNEVTKLNSMKNNPIAQSAIIAANTWINNENRMTPNAIEALSAGLSQSQQSQQQQPGYYESESEIINPGAGPSTETMTTPKSGVFQSRNKGKFGPKRSPSEFVTQY